MSHVLKKTSGFLVLSLVLTLPTEAAGLRALARVKDKISSIFPLLRAGTITIPPAAVASAGKSYFLSKSEQDRRRKEDERAATSQEIARIVEDDYFPTKLHKAQPKVDFSGFHDDDCDGSE